MYVFFILDVYYAILILMPADINKVRFIRQILVLPSLKQCSSCLA